MILIRRMQTGLLISKQCMNDNCSKSCHRWIYFFPRIFLHSNILQRENPLRGAIFARISASRFKAFFFFCSHSSFLEFAS
ncbi:unnamed protein product, partial [Vitis vinifera]